MAAAMSCDVLVASLWAGWSGMPLNMLDRLGEWCCWALRRSRPLYQHLVCGQSFLSGMTALILVRMDGTFEGIDSLNLVSKLVVEVMIRCGYW